MRASLVWYALAAVLVVAYVNTFVIWQELKLRFGEGASLAPWLLAAVLAIVAAVSWRRRMRRHDVSMVLLVAAVAVAIAGMLLTDPDYPAKRIHVPQYAILAAVIWLALRRNVDPGRIAVYTILVSVLFGIHDEFLQGLHPDRTFGVRDIAINVFGCVAGTLALAGLTGRRVFTFSGVPFPVAVLMGAAMSAAGLGLFVAALTEFRAQPIPYWTALPLLAGAFVLAWASVRDDSPDDVRHAGTVIVLLLIALSLYPVIANETPLVFA